MQFRLMLLLKSISVLLFTLRLDAAAPSMPLDILIFGGNGFIGSHVTDLLSSNGHNLTLINRGRWPWDTASSIKPKVHKIVTLDRTTQQGVEIFRRHVVVPRLQGGVARQFDLVIDLSAYEPDAVRPFYQALGEWRLARWYAFVSSHSVYEVCLPGPQPSLIREVDAIRPDDESLGARLIERDGCGHDKLRVEEFLRRSRSNQPATATVPYIVLRLPDVLGQRDSTLRWWKYQMWMKNFGRLNSSPITVPAFARNLPTSYVYVVDVARFFLQIVDFIGSSKDFRKITDQVYHVALPQPRLLNELLVHIKQGSRSDRAEIISDAKGNAAVGSNVFYFPSVTKGGLDTSRLQENFPQFETTDWHTMIHEIADFYEKASIRFPRERDKTALSLCRDLNFDQKTCEKFQTELLVEAERKRKLEL